jgi:Mg2+/citrate symporter
MKYCTGMGSKLYVNVARMISVQANLYFAIIYFGVLTPLGL